nr:transmembrane channel-like protein 7 [Pocillopora verrucosa]
MNRVAPAKDLESGEDLEDSLNIDHFQSDEADTPEPQTQRSRGNVRPESGFRSIHIPAGSTKAHRRSSLRRASLRNANNDLELNALNADAADEWLPTPKEVTRRMSERRLYRKSIKNAQRLKKQRISRWKAFKMQIAMSWKLTKTAVSEWSRDYELWKGHLKRVEGRFGNGVSSFFVFLKLLFFLNMATFILEFGFVTLPSVIIEPSTTSNSCTFTTAETQQRNTSSAAVAAGYEVADFISGKGWISTTLMFYAGYGDSELISNAGVKYNLPLAYLLVGWSFFILSLILVVRSLGESLAETYLDSGGSLSSFCNQIFAGWDFCITNEKTAQEKELSFLQNVKAQFAEEERQEKVQNRTTQIKCQLYTIRIVCFLLVLGLLGGAIYAIILSVSASTDPEIIEKASQFQSGEEILRFAPSLTITILNILLPQIFNILAKFEDWSPAFEVNITLYRNIILKLASLVVLMLKIYTQVGETCETSPEMCCKQFWENEIASQMYMLIWIDFFINIFSTIIVTTLWKLMYKHTQCFKKVGMPVFDIPKEVLGLVYGECLIWIGTFFSPIMPGMGAVKFFILFYVKLIAVMFNYRPSERVYKATRSNYLFTALLLISFFMCLGIIGWGVASMRPSCLGPFSNANCNADARMYQVLTKEISTWPSVVQDIINFVTTVTFIFPVLTVVCLLLYYFRSMALSLLQTIETLKDQLALEGRDKRKLEEKLYRYEEAERKSTKAVHPTVVSDKQRDSLAPPDSFF